MTTQTPQVEYIEYRSADDAMAAAYEYDFLQGGGGREPSTDELFPPQAWEVSPSEPETPPEKMDDGSGLVFAYGVEDALKPQPPLDHVVKDRILAGTLTTITGDGGIFKSYVGTDLGLHVARNIEWMGKEVVGGPVLIYDHENGENMGKRRLAALANGLGITSAPLTIMELADGDLGKPETIQMIERHILTTGARLVIFDPLISFKGDADEDKAGEMDPILDALRKLAQKYKCAVVVIHHNNKSGGYRGSVVIKQRSDTLINAEGDPSKKTLQLTTPKSRNMPNFTMNIRVIFDPEGRYVRVESNDQGTAESDDDNDGSNKTVNLEAVLYVLEELERGPQKKRDLERNADSHNLKAYQVKNAIYSLDKPQGDKPARIKRIDGGKPGEASVYALA